MYVWRALRWMEGRTLMRGGGEASMIRDDVLPGSLIENQARA